MDQLCRGKMEDKCPGQGFGLVVQVMGMTVRIQRAGDIDMESARSAQIDNRGVGGGLERRVRVRVTDW